MPEAWETTTTDERTENKTLIFIIFCEDQNDEPYYFRSFGIVNKLIVNCIPNQKKAKLNLLNTLAYCKDAELVEYVNHTYKVKDDITENIWCVYDRDLEDENAINIKSVDDLNFTTSIITATEAGIKVAWSNDAFELWVLLHFEQVQMGIKNHRIHIYTRLTEILKEFPAIKKEYSDSILKGTFNYKIHLKKRTAFINHVLPLLKIKVGDAINNAKELEKEFDHTVPYHDCNPCTKIHHLVNDLLLAQN